MATISATGQNALRVTKNKEAKTIKTIEPNSAATPKIIPIAMSKARTNTIMKPDASNNGSTKYPFQ